MTEIKRVPVDVYKEKKRCPECDTGYLQQTSGGVLTSDPPQYPHKCTECGYHMHIRAKTYPRIIYSEKE